MIFCGQAVGKTNSPMTLFRCSYDADKLRSRKFRPLPEDDYPWGICHSEYGDFTYEQRQWTREAMQIWNDDYEKYKLKEWDNNYVSGIPDGPLFVESCNDRKYNIIYTKTGDIYSKEKWAQYEEVDTWWDGEYFHSIITFDYKFNYKKNLFKNVMIHELGHALGLPHAPPHQHKGDSELMIAKGFACRKTGITEQLCKLQPIDFWSFIKIYDPPKAITRSPAEKKRAEYLEKHRLKIETEWFMAGCPDNTGSPQGCI